MGGEKESAAAPSQRSALLRFDKHCYDGHTAFCIDINQQKPGRRYIIQS